MQLTINRTAHAQNAAPRIKNVLNVSLSEPYRVLVSNTTCRQQDCSCLGQLHVGVNCFRAMALLFQAPADAVRLRVLTLHSVIVEMCETGARKDRGSDTSKSRLSSV